MGCHRFREKVVSELDAQTRRMLCPLPCDIRYGCSFQIAFKIQANPEGVPPNLVAWANGHASRQTSRGFDQVEVLGPVDHQKFIMEHEDWEDHLPNYTTFRDVNSDQKQNELTRVLEPYVLGRGGIVWRQHEIDDWNEFQSKKNTPCTVTPRNKPRMWVDPPRRKEYSSRIPNRGCPPDTPAEIPAAVPVPVGAAKGKSKGKRGKVPDAQAAPPWYQGNQPSSSGSWRGYPTGTDPQAWSPGGSWQR